MKVLVVSSHPDRSEAHIYTALHRQGVGVEVMCDPDVRLEGANSEGGLATSHVRFRSRLDFGAMRFVRERVKSAAFDVVYMVQKRCCTNVMASLVGIDVPIVSYRGVMGNISRWNPETRLTYFSRKMKRIICVSEAVRQSLLALGIPADKAVTVYKGHAASWYQPGDRNCLEEFGVPSDAFAVGCAARLRKRKGIDVLLRAAAKLRETNIHFLLVGNVVDKYVAVHGVCFLAFPPAACGTS